ncbi:MAG: histidine--tRNA ligase, partial [Cytophagales bacterium]|nr:histidine--tRNA ligase [Cytophagales bacterium]
MKKIFGKNVNGTRDLFGKNFYQREYIIDAIKEIYKLHGFSPLETPTFEHLSTLLFMYGEENSKLIYKILNSGNFLEDVEIEKENHQTLSNKICKKGLRYDLTVPLMRFVSNNFDEIIFPFKRYQIQPVFRADRPQKGRYREFYQCDADIVGSESLLCEIELLTIIIEVFEKLKISDFTIKVNDRQLLSSLANSFGVSEENFEKFSSTIDKLDKVEFENIKSELLAIGIEEGESEILKNILQQRGDNRAKLNFITDYFGQKKFPDESLENLNFILENSPEEVLGKVDIDFSLARGLAYYTGIILEVKINNVEIGSVAGGGRYHKFAEVYDNPQLKTVGMSFGIDRLIIVLEELNLFPIDEGNTT